MRLWNAATGVALHSFTVRSVISVKAVAFSPDSKQLDLAPGDQTVQLEDTATETAIQTLKVR
jgi:WD40 repeat protein